MALSIDDLPGAVGKLKALRVAAHAAEGGADARAAALAAEVDRRTERAERLDHIVSVLRRAQFGRRSEKIDEDRIDSRWRMASVSFCLINQSVIPLDIELADKLEARDTVLGARDEMHREEPFG